MGALLLTHAAELLTLAGPPGPRRGAAMGELGRVRDGAVLIADGTILRAGPTDEVARHIPPELGAVEEVDCSGRLVTPGLVDAHTHLVNGGARLDDFERRVRGASYADLAAAGGGIQQSVRQLRALTEPALVHGATLWLERARALGTTTLEAKTGYGLSVEAECTSLRAAATAAHATGVEVVRTFLGAHTVPAEYAGRRAEYVELVNGAMLAAALATTGAAPEFADVFCDPAGFTLAESRTVLAAARRHGLGLKLHAEQFTHTGGAALAVELGAVSVDHLEASSEQDWRRLGDSPTVAVLLPGANFLMGQPWAPARALIACGAAVALATDFNPGTCPIISLPLIMSLACTGLHLSPAEAWMGVTLNAAAALARDTVCGSLEVGKRADLALFDCDDHRAVPCHAGVNLCCGVVQHGRWRPQTSGRLETAPCN